MTDTNRLLANLFKLPTDTFSATLQMQAGERPVLTVQQFVRFDDLNKPVYSSARFELVAITDQIPPDRIGKLDTTSLDDGGTGSSVCS
jgi:hypothetical protein